MKTLKEIKQEITDLQKEINDPETPLRVKKANKKRIELLKICKLYIESNPREEFLSDSAHELSRKIDVLESRFNLWLETKNGDPKKLKLMYNKESGITTLKAQLRTIKYLVS